jgi:uncharacterized membrane protein HdeD (DUF308 family)
MSNNKKYFNPSAAVARNCFIAAVVGVLVFFYPIVFPIETYGAGFAINLLGILIFLTGLISGFVFLKMAGNLNKLVSGEGLLAHWTYSADEWSRYTEAEHLRDKKDKWQLFRLITIIAVIVGVVFVIIDHEAGLFVLAIIAGLILIIAFTAWASIASAYRQNRSQLGEVYIGMSGALLGRAFHYWKLPTAFLRSATFQEGDPPFIQLDYSSPSGQARGEYTARFPIPRGHEEEAKQVLAQLTAEIAGE